VFLLQRDGTDLKLTAKLEPAGDEALRAEVARLKAEVAALTLADAAKAAKLAKIHEESKP
jgi:hypothetical protein